MRSWIRPHAPHASENGINCLIILDSIATHRIMELELPVGSCTPVLRSSASRMVEINDCFYPVEIMQGGCIRSSRAQARTTLGREFPTFALSMAKRVPSSRFHYRTLF